MRICENGIMRDMTHTEIAEMESQTTEAERHTINHAFKEVKQ